MKTFYIWLINEQTEMGLIMSTIERLKSEIDALPNEKYVELRQWFSEKDWRNWDEQIKTDSRTGKLDFLIKEVNAEKDKGNIRNL